MPVIMETKFTGTHLFSRGKVRDTWEVPPIPGDGLPPLLFQVTTDRISAFDCVMNQGIPDAGKARSILSLFWFRKLADICPNHIHNDNQQECGTLFGKAQCDANDAIGRSAIVCRAEVFPVECIVRGYMFGSVWKPYQLNGTAFGLKLPPRLILADKLPEPIFTPTTKAKTGHDEPLTFDGLVGLVGGDVAEELRHKSLQIYKEGVKHAEPKGVIVADTKLEFGRLDGKIILVDELLTPDSSRFWDAASYIPGTSPPSMDKQPLRDYLESTGWDKHPPPPDLPDSVVNTTSARYRDICARLTGESWAS